MADIYLNLVDNSGCSNGLFGVVVAAVCLVILEDERRVRTDSVCKL